MNVEQYIENINKRYKLGNATEHTFRGDLQQLLESIVPTIRATNEPKRQKCGAPDYILTQKDIPIGFIEAKDIGDKDLEGAKKTGNKEQFDRYKESLNNIIFTDYLDFYLYRDGQFVRKIAIGEIAPSPSGKFGEEYIKPLSENFSSFENFIKDFCTYIGQTINNTKTLAEMMAGKARLLADVIEKALTFDENNYENSTLKDQMEAFRQILIHDITPKGFADVYAQTIAYGMFAARYHDPTLPTFSRQEAYELIPKSNPFLKKLFGYIAGLEVDDRIKWIIDDLVNIFLACNVEEMLKDYGKATKMEDPIIHFYEDFLSKYDPALRKARGVWYTPQPVVNFMVRAVDDILKTEFDLPNGLADSSKTKAKIDKQGKEIEQEVHKVQILDPATGTGTFLAEIVKHIHKKFEGQQGIWSNYVETHLLPRLNGFELLMASYAMAHLKLDLLLTETGYKPTLPSFGGAGGGRLRVFLTNSLEESHPDTGSLFANWLSIEANEANHIKRDTPVMCVIGNPPYSVSSTNKGEWIEKLITDYKKNLNERNIQPLSDDYIKFICFGQHFIEKNGSGVLAYISNNSFIDGIIHRQMRKRLLESFDKIYIIDLHGSTKKNEIATDGGKDENVFDIQQGVSINVFVKTGKKLKDELAQVFHYDLFGKRKLKYDFLKGHHLKSISWNVLKVEKPYFFFTKKNFAGASVYEAGFKIDKLFEINACGIVTARDNLLIKSKKIDIESLINDFSILDEVSFRKKYNERKDSRDWTYQNAKKDIKSASIQSIDYRPFDKQFVIYTTKSRGILSYPRNEVMKHMISSENIGLLTCKQQSSFDFQHIFITKSLSDKCSVSLQTKEATYHFPLYLYPDTNGQQEIKIKHQLDEQQLLELRKEELLTLIDSSEKSFKIIQKMYESVENPDKEIQKLYKTQAKNLQKLKYELKELQSKLSIQKNKQPIANQLFKPQVRVPNLDRKIVKQIAEKLDLIFTYEKETTQGTFAPIDILDYIYAVLHSPSYREKYKEFLRIDFPIVPYPKDLATFWQLVNLGSQVRQIHLLESKKVEQFTTQYPIDGNNLVAKIKYQEGKVYINDTQYFSNVPQVAWEFYIGGYQPAQKWLRDRKDRKLEADDLLHYQKIIVALIETDRLMNEINKIDIE